jgi:hypothetical protein
MYGLDELTALQRLWARRRDGGERFEWVADFVLQGQLPRTGVPPVDPPPCPTPLSGPSGRRRYTRLAWALMKLLAACARVLGSRG